MKKTILALLLVLICIGSLAAFDGYVIVYNRTGYDIYELYVSHEYDDDFGYDQLGSDVLEDGDSFSVDVSGKTPLFDIMAIDEDGDEYYFWNLDCEYNDISLTIDYLD